MKWQRIQETLSKGEHDWELERKELIDVANFAMMLWDRS